MKKTFKLTHNKLHPDRLVDAIKHEVKKYIKRERNRKLPDGTDYWDFDCRFGADEGICDVIHMSEINKSIDGAVEDKLESFYLEILARAATRNKNTDQD